MREEDMSDWAHQADEAVLAARAGFERVVGGLSLFLGNIPPCNEIFLERLPGGGLMDKRLLPHGFVWGVSLVAVYAAVLTFFVSDFIAVGVWSFVLGALLAAIYTHLDRPELPKDEEPWVGKIKIVRFKVIYWHIGFWWLAVLSTASSSLSGLLPYYFMYAPSEIFETSYADTFQGALIGWFSTRMPYLMPERLRGKSVLIEWTGILVLIQLAIVYYLFVEQGFLYTGLFLNIFPIALFFLFYKNYKGNR